MLASVVLLPLLAAPAHASPPSSLAAPADAFETTGAVAPVVEYVLPPQSGAVATLVVDVEDCGTFTYASNTSGTVARSGNTTRWTLALDLSACRGEGGVIRTHHCDGYGSTFETCEIVGDGGADRAVTLAFTLRNRNGVALCTDDLDGDGTNECGFAEGTLLADVSEQDVYVPARWWTEDADGWSCWSRTEGAGVRDPWNQGGDSCDGL